MSKRRVVLYGMTSGLSAPGFMRGQAPFLRRHSWDVALACAPEGDVEAFCAAEGISYWPVPLARTASVIDAIRGWRVLWRMLSAVAPSVTIWGSPKASLLGTLACRLRNIPSIYLIHGLRLEGATGPTRAALRWAELLTCRLASVVVCDGFELRSVAERLGVVREGTALVLASGSANGVNPIRSTPRYRAELGLAEDDLLVVFAARITGDKGIRELAEAWEITVARHPRAILVVAGRTDAADPKSGELEASLRRLARTVLLGHIPDLDRLWADADLAVLPSYREGLPLVIIEAAAAGVPAVVADFTGARECVDDRVTGLVVPRRDPNALSEALSTLLADPTARRAMGSAARERAVARYDREVLWAALEKLLTDCADQAGRPRGGPRGRGLRRRNTQ